MNPIPIITLVVTIILYCPIEFIELFHSLLNSLTVLLFRNFNYPIVLNSYFNYLVAIILFHLIFIVNLPLNFNSD